jgi:hypothetical protein
MPFPLDEFWRKQLGELSISKLQESSVYFLAVSDNPGQENLLEKRLSGLHYGLLLQGLGYNATQYFGSGMRLAGSINNREFIVKLVGDMLRHYRPYKVAPGYFGKEEAEIAQAIASGIDEIYSHGEDYLRIRKGFRAFTEHRPGQTLRNRPVCLFDRSTEPSKTAVICVAHIARCGNGWRIPPSRRRRRHLLMDHDAIIRRRPNARNRRRIRIFSGGFLIFDRLGFGVEECDEVAGDVELFVRDGDD